MLIKHLGWMEAVLMIMKGKINSSLHIVLLEKLIKVKSHLL